jgi:hypothetical protein
MSALSTIGSNFNGTGPYRQLDALSIDTQLQTLRSYCDQHPLAIFADAVNELYKNFHSLKLRQRPARPRNRHRRAFARCGRGRQSKRPIPRRTTAAESGARNLQTSYRIPSTPRSALSAAAAVAKYQPATAFRHSHIFLSWVGAKSPFWFTRFRSGNDAPELMAASLQGLRRNLDHVVSG